MDVTPSHSPTVVALRRSDVARHPRLAEAADRPGLRVLDDTEADRAPLALVLRDSGLWLVGRRPPLQGAAQIDLVGGRLGARLRRASARGEALLRAVGATSGRLPSVLDATAGWARDTGLLARRGCAVTAAERSPVLALLLADALDRARADPEVGRWAAGIRLHPGDARTILSGESSDRVDVPEVVLLDPMFPPRRGSALVRLPLRLAAAVVGRDDDSVELLRAALASPARRVVVRRPVEAPPLLGDPAPTLAVPGGRTTRYDVWLRAD